MMFKDAAGTIPATTNGDPVGCLTQDEICPFCGFTDVVANAEGPDYHCPQCDHDFQLLPKTTRTPEEHAELWKDHKPSLPKCPKCGSTAKRCKRPSEHSAPDWHVEREDLAARACGCPGCQEWLKSRGQA